MTSHDFRRGSKAQESPSFFKAGKDFVLQSLGLKVMEEDLGRWLPSSVVVKGWQLASGEVREVIGRVSMEDEPSCLRMVKRS